ncbi:MAG: FmdB family zinc ribbon protein [Planctomycetota bacterium]|jgi:putative FmdB family regulatory protein
MNDQTFSGATMPTYEYVCESCNHGFELFQKISDPPAECCPECGGKARRLISGGAGIIVKNPGPEYCRDGGKPHRNVGGCSNACREFHGCEE